MGILSEEEFWEKYDQITERVKVMTMPTSTEKVAKNGVLNKQNFKQGYISGKWFSPNEIDEDNLGGLPVIHRQIIKKHNENADLFVVYSYSTPIAWFSLKNSGSKGTNKWYFPTVRYSEQMDQHQHFIRALLKEKLTKLLPNGKQMK